MVRDFGWILYGRCRSVQRPVHRSASSIVGTHGIHRSLLDCFFRCRFEGQGRAQETGRGPANFDGYPSSVVHLVWNWLFGFSRATDTMTSQSNECNGLVTSATLVRPPLSCKQRQLRQPTEPHAGQTAGNLRCAAGVQYLQTPKAHRSR